MGQSLFSMLLVGKQKTPEQIRREKAEEKYKLQQEFAEIERKNKIWEEKNAKEEALKLDELSNEILEVFNNYFNISQIIRMRHWDKKLCK